MTSLPVPMALTPSSAVYLRRSSCARLGAAERLRERARPASSSLASHDLCWR